MTLFNAIRAATLGIYLVMPCPAVAAFDGSQPLICASITAVECEPNGQCQSGAAEEINAPQFFHLDFESARVRAARPDGTKVDAPFEGGTPDSGQLVFQGIENGRAWSATISEETGKLVISASGDGVAFVIFGACTPSP